MILFEECPVAGYTARTKVNAEQADLTIAIAKNYKTAGERLTFNSAKEYLSFDLCSHDDPQIANIKTRRLIRAYSLIKPTTVNIAGNGLYTLKDYGITQIKIDQMIYALLGEIYLVCKRPTLIRSGGQTGADEAGLKAARKLGIPALCYAPKYWRFRDETGKDICDEQKFKQRFAI